MKAYTNYFNAFNDVFEEVQVLSYDRNLYVNVLRSDNSITRIKAGYLYTKSTGKNFVSRRKLYSLPTDVGTKLTNKQIAQYRKDSLKESQNRFYHVIVYFNDLPKLKGDQTNERYTYRKRTFKAFNDAFKYFHRFGLNPKVFSVALMGENQVVFGKSRVYTGLHEYNNNIWEY